MADSNNAPDNFDPIVQELKGLRTHLLWVGEHRASFEHYRDNEPKAAQIELENLRESTDRAIEHLNNLTELLIAGKSVDVSRSIPPYLKIKLVKRK